MTHERYLKILEYAAQMGLSYEDAKRTFPEPHSTYYFINTAYRYLGEQIFSFQHEVADIHPFQVIADYNKDQPKTEIVLISWQEITKEEYDLYNKLEEQLNG